MLMLILSFFTVNVGYTWTMNERYRTLYTEAHITHEIARIAQEIIATHHESAPLFVALLRGAAPFASKLLFEIAKQAPGMHPELDYMMVRTYGSGKTAGTPEIITDITPGTEVKDRTVIILDDVLDKGVTAQFVRNHFLDRGAQNVQLAVLVQKDTERYHPITADYYGFTARDEWLVGMGMDDADLTHEGNRWLGEIREIIR